MNCRRHSTNSAACWLRAAAGARGFPLRGYDAEALTSRRQKAGFDLFDDSSNFPCKGRPLSLNLRARKKAAA